MSGDDAGVDAAFDRLAADCCKGRAQYVPLERFQKAEAELARVTGENERLLEWQRLHDAAPEQAKGVVLDRLRESGALTPIVESWKAEVEKLTEQLNAAREALPARIERSLRAYDNGDGITRCDKCDRPRPPTPLSEREPKP